MEGVLDSTYIPQVEDLLISLKNADNYRVVSVSENVFTAVNSLGHKANFSVSEGSYSYLENFFRYQRPLIIRKSGGVGVPGTSEVMSTTQPPPKQGGGDMWMGVIEKMFERRRMGIKKYGVPLQTGNGRDPLKDAFEEALDLCVYLWQAIEERDNASQSKV